MSRKRREREDEKDKEFPEFVFLDYEIDVNILLIFFAFFRYD